MQPTLLVDKPEPLSMLFILATFCISRWENAGASYVAFGAFYPSKTKKTKYVASVKILNKIKKITKTPTVAIGGINAINYKNLLLNNANFLAISGYIWKNKKYKPLQAIERLK